MLAKVAEIAVLYTRELFEEAQEEYGLYVALEMLSNMAVSCYEHFEETTLTEHELAHHNGFSEPVEFIQAYARASYYLETRYTELDPTASIFVMLRGDDSLNPYDQRVSHLVLGDQEDYLSFLPLGHDDRLTIRWSFISSILKQVEFNDIRRQYV